MAPFACVICSERLAAPPPQLYEFPAITSDCRPWPAGRSVALCPSCGVMHRAVLPEAQPIFAKVYEHYEMFKHSATASDQINFSQGGLPEGRTQKILKFIHPRLPSPPAAVLDVGSGSGAGLCALAHQFPSASVYGFEPNDRPAERQKSLPDNVVSIMNRRPDAQRRYDLVTLFHVFEHMEDIFEQLAFVASVLSPGGHVLIQVPYPMTGPFDLIIADHLWHYSKKSLVLLLRKAGFVIAYIGNEVIEKELTVLAAPGEPESAPLFPPPDDEYRQGLEAVEWLTRYKAFLDRVGRSVDQIAVYGTGPAGAWAGHVLGDKVFAYIDDDPARLHSSFNGKPVVAPHEIGQNMAVVAPFPDYQAQWIAKKNPGLNILLFSSHLTSGSVLQSSCG